ncbi:MAG TPA: hypothetical protein PKZ76_09245 [Xanthomonadaceae bacterium]|nr:hypothetical protein [Xanthomonadaceae bacterium]
MVPPVVGCSWVEIAPTGHQIMTWLCEWFMATPWQWGGSGPEAIAAAAGTAVFDIRACDQHSACRRSPWAQDMTGGVRRALAIVLACVGVLVIGYGVYLRMQGADLFTSALPWLLAGVICIALAGLVVLMGVFARYRKDR